MEVLVFALLTTTCARKPNVYRLLWSLRIVSGGFITIVFVDPIIENRSTNKIYPPYPPYPQTTEYRTTEGIKREGKGREGNR